MESSDEHAPEHLSPPPPVGGGDERTYEGNPPVEVRVKMEPAPANDETADQPAVSEEQDEAARLRALGAGLQDQDDLERNIGRQADLLLAEKANEQEQKRLDKAKAERRKLQSQVSKIQSKLNQRILPGAATVARLQNELDNYLAQIEELNQDVKDIEARMKERDEELEGLDDKPDDSGRLPGESQRDFLIRTGKITPFSKLAQPTSKALASLDDALYDAEQNKPEEDEEADAGTLNTEHRSHRNLVQPGFDSGNHTETSDDPDAASRRPKKRRKVTLRTEISAGDVHEDGESDGSDFKPDVVDDEVDEEQDNSTADDEEDNFYNDEATTNSKKRRAAPGRHGASDVDTKDDLTGVDDGNESLFQSRIDRWVDRRSAARNKQQTPTGEEPSASEDAEWHLPHPTQPDMAFEGGYRLPGDIHPALFDYQKTGVQWLWELYSQQVGGIVGDEMGLGKTIQIIAFLAGLHYSKKITKPIVVVCPATVMKQWVNEFHLWWPAFRVSILHTSGSGMIDIGRESRQEEELLSRSFAARSKTPLTKSERAAKKIVDRVVKDGHILVTTYSGLQTYSELLIPVDWEYAVLDEGHKIRNPNASITIHCKELRTANRVILSGTPMQNNLVELWSLFDFVFPMRLGTLVNFRSSFEIPIRQGGYANASNLAIQTANKCAEMLKDSIAPYLLQRLKVDVASDLPKKTEQVLFCKLTREQRRAYETFLKGHEMQGILNGKRQMLYGIDILRKICNHPDLVDRKLLQTKVGYDYGDPKLSGKMMVVKELLDIWSKGGHKTLLFAQHRIMLDILEKYIGSIPGINFRRMDGTTPIVQRQKLVDEFNTNQDLHVFLLTTKVGGLGVNLTGANRVIIFDPDWNPSTDIQARERAWRLGQKREVQIYRLMVAGTIEEKIFHRQIFKQFLTNKILKDPKQRQTFQMKDLHDLFTLGGEDEDATETGKMFAGTETKIDAKQPSWGGDGQDPNPKTDQADDHGLGDINGIASIQQSAEAEPTKADGNQEAAEQRMMAGIFARSGVSSTLEHDQIINGKRVVAADAKMIDRAAKQVAAEAAKSLKNAEKVAKATPIGVPTWTGQVGQAGRTPSPPPRRGFGIGGGSRRGPSSAGVLANLQNRGSPVASRSRTATPPQGQGFLVMIRDYLLAHGGAVYSQNLIDHFSRLCTNESRVAEFRASLREIATLQQGLRGRGKWTLKEEYRKKPAAEK